MQIYMKSMLIFVLKEQHQRSTVYAYFINTLQTISSTTITWYVGLIIIISIIIIIIGTHIRCRVIIVQPASLYTTLQTLWR